MCLKLSENQLAALVDAAWAKYEAAEDSGYENVHEYHDHFMAISEFWRAKGCLLNGKPVQCWCWDCTHAVPRAKIYSAEMLIALLRSKRKGTGKTDSELVHYIVRLKTLGGFYEHEVPMLLAFCGLERANIAHLILERSLV